MALASDANVLSGAIVGAVAAVTRRIAGLAAFLTGATGGGLASG
jgi:hypothetical protein